MKQGKGKKGRQSANHKAKRAAATLRRNARSNVRKVEREKRVSYFKTNKREGSPSQVALRFKLKRAKARKDGHSKAWIDENPLLHVTKPRGS
jgi:hypothetical protein